MRLRLPLLILMLLATAGAVLIAVWLLHAHSVWSAPLSPTFSGADLHYPVVRLASLAVAAASGVAAALAFAARRSRMMVAGVLLLGSAVLVMVGLQSSPAHMWFGSLHPESVLHYSRRFRTAALIDFVAAAACAVAVVFFLSSRSNGTE